MLERFPADFFHVSVGRGGGSDFEVADCDLKVRPGRASLRPYIFTEQGVAMLSEVLRSKRAIAVNIEIMRAFVELRRAAASYSALEKPRLALLGDEGRDAQRRMVHLSRRHLAPR